MSEAVKISVGVLWRSAVRGSGSAWVAVSDGSGGGYGGGERK